jgi:hypothetical protein
VRDVAHEKLVDKTPAAVLQRRDQKRQREVRYSNGVL